MGPGCLRKRRRWKNGDGSADSAWSAGEYCLSVRDTGSSSGRSMQQEIISLGLGKLGALWILLHHNGIMK